MQPAVLEHVNITVTEPEKTAALLCNLFDWRIRWQGPAKLGGYTVHVGGDDDYLAVYSYPPAESEETSAYSAAGILNHVGIVVEDLDRVEKRVIEAGFAPYNHGDYEPGKRFYFNDHDDIEYEVVSYT
ncbi:MAG: VOC family protein [Pseudomonadaceae bacterium]|nr:VOC family protein [Pseudomonadaceae bacterium]